MVVCHSWVKVGLFACEKARGDPPGAIYRKYGVRPLSDLTYCLQEPGDTVCLPARTVHFVFSVTPNIQWNYLLSHNVLHTESEAVALECKALNRCSGPPSRTVQGRRTKRSGVTKKRFTPRRRVKSS